MILQQQIRRCMHEVHDIVSSMRIVLLRQSESYMPILATGKS